jgi:hypothetical protein
MPVCISCGGEYWAPPIENQTAGEEPPSETPASAFDEMLADEEDQESGEPTPTPPPPAPLLELAQLYGRHDLPPFVCARCGQSNERWHAWDTAGGGAHFRRFFVQSIPWGWLALISIALPALAAWLADFTPVASERIGIPLALVLIFVNVALLYALRDSLWRFDVLSRVGRGFRPSLATMAVTAFLLALIFGLALAFMVQAHADKPAAAPTESLLRVTTTILLALTFVDVTLSALFMAGHDYGHWLNREMPQPIYAQERRLLGVIEDGLRVKLRQVTGKDKPVDVTLVDMERTGDAGVILSVSTETDAEEETFKKSETWKVTTDRWGQIKKMSREGPHQYVKLPADDEAKAEDGKKAGAEALEKAEPISRWEQNYHRQSATTISISSRNRQWTE